MQRRLIQRASTPSTETCCCATVSPRDLAAHSVCAALIIIMRAIAHRLRRLPLHLSPLCRCGCCRLLLLLSAADADCARCVAVSGASWRTLASRSRAGRGSSGGSGDSDESERERFEWQARLQQPASAQPLVWVDCEMT